MSSYLLPSVVVAFAVTRLCIQSYAVPTPAEIPALGVLADESSLHRLGVEQVTYQIFDPTAVVVVLAGADQMPGVAGTDDNINGVVDDRLELGATRSDDPCVVMTADRLAQIPADTVLVLQRGAFVEIDGPESNDRCRARVFGKFDNGDRWSALIDID